MNALAFDTLAYARRLEGVGFTREQAEALADEQAKLIDGRLATKTDIEGLRLATKSEIEGLRLATTSEIEGLRLATTSEIEGLRLATKSEIEGLRLTTKAEIESLRLATKADIESAKNDVLKLIIGSIGIQTVVVVGALTALVRLFAH